MVTPEFVPLLAHSLTVHLVNSHSPPYASRIDPSTPPMTERTEAGLSTLNGAMVVLSVQKVKGFVLMFEVVKPVRASAMFVALKGFRITKLSRYDKCLALNVTMPLMGAERRYISNGSTPPSSSWVQPMKQPSSMSA